MEVENRAFTNSVDLSNDHYKSENSNFNNSNN